MSDEITQRAAAIRQRCEDAPELYAFAPVVIAELCDLIGEMSARVTSLEAERSERIELPRIKLGRTLPAIVLPPSEK